MRETQHLLKMYKDLLDQSDFFGLSQLTSEDFDIHWWYFNRGVNIEQYKRNVMEMIVMSLDSEPLRQALTIFLALNAICKKYKDDNKLEGKLVFKDPDICGPSAYFPNFSVNMEPHCVFEGLTFCASTEVSSLLGYARVISDAPEVLGHEFRHGYHIPLGLGNHNYSEYVENYLHNPFLKELLFKDFERIQEDIRQDILKTMQELSEEDAPQFVGQICSFFNLSSLENADLPEKLALAAINSIWDDQEEIQNIIGVQMVGDTLFINRLSDLNVSLSRGKSVHWTHLSGDKQQHERSIHFQELERPPVTDPRAKDFIRQFYEKYSILSETPLNHPTPEALLVLQILHGVTGLVRN
jgi:hypothetical protein